MDRVLTRSPFQAYIHRFGNDSSPCLTTIGCVSDNEKCLASENSFDSDDAGILLVSASNVQSSLK